MSEKELQQIAEEMSNSDKYVSEIAEKVYSHIFKDFSRLEDYMKASNERSHREMTKKYYSLERKAWLIAIVLLLLQFLFK